jgi:uncharacterized membrane protein YfcA
VVDLTLLHVAFLVAAGVVAGVVGTAGGITSLISYPALLAVGIGPLPANLTNSIAVIGSGLGATAGSRIELAGHPETVRRCAPSMVIGSLAGAVLLLVTPAAIFEWIVPFLILTATILMLAQPAIKRRSANRDKLPQMPLIFGFSAGSPYTTATLEQDPESSPSQ